MTVIMHNILRLMKVVARPAQLQNFDCSSEVWTHADVDSAPG